MPETEKTYTAELTEWELDEIFLALNDRARQMRDTEAESDTVDLAAKIGSLLPTGDAV